MPHSLLLFGTVVNFLTFYGFFATYKYIYVLISFPGSPRKIDLYLNGYSDCKNNLLFAFPYFVAISTEFKSLLQLVITRYIPSKNEIKTPLCPYKYFDSDMSVLRKRYLSSLLNEIVMFQTVYLAIDPFLFQKVP